MTGSSDSYRRIYETVRRVPEGRVATYGQIAAEAGLGKHARLVGYALNVCPEDLPWHRVINARGEVSGRSDEFYENRQRRRLEAEGVVFDARGRVSLTRFRWNPIDDWAEDALTDEDLVVLAAAERRAVEADPLVDPDR